MFMFCIKFFEYYLNIHATIRVLYVTEILCRNIVINIVE